MKKFIKVSAILLVMLLALSGCGSKTNETPAENTAKETEVEASTETEVVTEEAKETEVFGSNIEKF